MFYQDIVHLYHYIIIYILYIYHIIRSLNNFFQWNKFQRLVQFNFFDSWKIFSLCLYCTSNILHFIIYFRFMNLSLILLQLLLIELILQICIYFIQNFKYANMHIFYSELFVLRIYLSFFFYNDFVTLKKFLCDYYFFKNLDLYLIFVKNLSLL